MIKDVQSIIKMNNKIVNLDDYHAVFIGYDVSLAEFEQKSYKTLYGNKKKFIKNDYDPHNLKVFFLVDGFRNTLEFISLLNNPIIKFTDDLLIYECIINNYVYEYVSGYTYQVELSFDCYIYSEEIKIHVNDDTNVFINSPKPTPLNLYIYSKNSINNKEIVIQYFDYYLNKDYKNKIIVKALNKDQCLFIDSNNFVSFVDDNLNLNAVSLNLYPYVKDNVRIEGLDDSISLNIVYRRQY